MDQSDKASCIIPDSIFDACTGKGSEHDSKLWSVLKPIAGFESGEAEQNRHVSAIESKLDEITRLLNDNNSVNKAISKKLDQLSASVYPSTTQVDDVPEVKDSPVKQLRKNISKVKSLTGKYLRAEHMSSYTEELLEMSPPFVQRKYRIKVNSDSHADEIESYEQDAIGRASRETERLRIRMRRWDQELAKLKEEIKEALANPNISGPDKIKMEHQLKKDEDVNRKKSLNAFQRIQKTCEKEMESGGSQFLLKYVEKRHWGPEGGGIFQKSKQKIQHHHSRQQKSGTRSCF